LPIRAFDANFEQRFEFLLSGNQSVRNRLTIFDNDTAQIIYNETQDTLRLSHILPAGTLENGKNYSCEITSYSIDNAAMTSSRIFFICLTTPIWGFLNLSPNQIIRNSTYTIEIDYYQHQGEILNEHRVSLYNSSMSEVWNSGNRFGDVYPVEIGGLANSTQYYIRAQGRTVNGFVLDTSFIPFLVEYESIGLFSVLRLENRDCEASVRIQSNIVTIEGRYIPEGEEPVFIDNEMIDLREEGRAVIFDEGFRFDGDFLIQFTGFGFNENTTLLTLSDGWSNVNILWRKGNFDNGDGLESPHSYAELIAEPSPHYILYSNYLTDVSDTDMVHVWFRRVNGLYQIKISEL
jgi:hypothetical protein